MISSTLNPIAIGTLPGENPTPASSQSLGQVLRLLNALGARFGTPFQIQSLTQAPGPHAWSEWRAFLLGHPVQGAPLLRELPRPAVLEAPWIPSGVIQPGSLIWPFEDTQALRTSAASELPAAWIETTALSKESIQRAAELADLRARELEQSAVAWVNSGFGEVERYALDIARSALKGREIQVFPIEEIFARLRTPGQTPPVLLTLGKTAIPLGRMLGIQAWVARSGSQPEETLSLLQAWGDAGAALVMAPLLDALGLLREAEEMNGAIRELLRESPATNSDPLSERVIRRLEVS